MYTLFISDLHLQKDQPAITEDFLSFLTGISAEVDALYILGDLFEAWVGDDDINPYNRRIMEKLKDLTTGGLPIFFMAGNRDFLLGKDFAKETGIQLLPDPSVVMLYGTPTLLMHGDTLCIDDKDYLAFREKIRNPKLQHQLLSKPLWVRKLIASFLRYKSKKASRGKKSYLMDANEEEMKRVMAAFHVKQLIHGHTHRPSIHLFEGENAQYRRVVLGDWGPAISVLSYSETGKVRLYPSKDAFIAGSL